MPKMQNHARTYTAALAVDSASPEVIDLLAFNCQRVLPNGQAEFGQFWLNVLGAMRLPWLEASPRSKYAPGTMVSRTKPQKPPKPKAQSRGVRSKKKNRDAAAVSVATPEPAPPPSYTTAVHAFSCWFSLEAGLHHPFALEPHQVAERFFHYWKEDGGDPGVANDVYLKLVMPALTEYAKRPDAVWVDRRKAAAAYFPADFTADHLRRVLVHPIFPLQEGGDQAACATLFSQYLGQGEKSDFVREAQLNSILAAVLEEAGNTPIWQVIVDFLRRVGAPAEAMDAEDSQPAITWLREQANKKGRGDFKAALLKDFWQGGGKSHADGQKRIAQLLKTMAERQHKIESRVLEATTATPVWDWLKSRAEAEAGVPYDATHFAQMADLAVARMRTHIKSFYNQLDERRELTTKLTELRTVALRTNWVAAAVAAYKASVEQAFLHQCQLHGLRDVLQEWANTPADLVGGVSRADEAYTRRFGDAKLFTALAEVMVEQEIKGSYDQLKETIGHDLELLANRDEVEECLRDLKWPRLVVPSPSSYVHPWFGVSKPRLKILPPLPGSQAPFRLKQRGAFRKANGLAPHFHAEMRLFSRDGTLVDVVVPFHGRRFVKENLIPVEGAPAGLRNHRLAAIRAGSADVNPSGAARPTDDVALSPRYDPERQHWGCAISKTYTTGVDWTHLQQGSYPVLAVHFGVRSSGWYALLRKETAGQGDFQLEDTKHPCGVTLLDAGQVEDPILRETGDERCVLRGQSTSELPDCYWDTWMKYCGDIKDKALPRDFIGLSLDLSSALQELAKKFRAGMITCERSQIEVLLRATLGRLHDGEASRALRGQGGLSRLRTLKFEKLVRGLQSFADTFRKKGLEPPDWLTDQLSSLRTKLLHIRHERARRIAATVVRMALQHNCLMVCHEDMEFQDRSSFDRKSNRRITDWSVRRAMDHLKETCSLEGLFRKVVSPAGASSYSASEGHPAGVGPTTALRCRYDLCSDGALREFTKDFTRLTKLEDLGRMDALRLQAWKETLEAHGLAPEPVATKALKTPCLLPRPGGIWFPNPDLADLLESLPNTAEWTMAGGFVDADVNAAVNAGLRSLWWFSEPKSKQLATEAAPQ